MQRFDVAGLTDVGNVREKNEDQFLVANLTKTLQLTHSSIEVGEEARISDSQGQLLIVADGMGGRSRGERASAVVVCSLADSMLNMLRWHVRASARREPEVMADLREAVLLCQRQMGDEVRHHPKAKGMGTTLTLAYILWPRMFVVHVGDSRCYVLRNGQLKQLTRDHTWAQLLVDSHKLSADQARTSKYNHILWNVVGGESDDIQPDIFCEDLEFGDTVLLCTDGLTKHVNHSYLAESLDRDLPAETLCQQLIEATKRGGGSDNVTVIVARFPASLSEEEHAERCLDALSENKRSSCDSAKTVVF